MSRIGQVAHIRGGAMTWLVSGDANAGGVSGTITSTGTAGDRWMLWGELYSYTNCDYASLSGGSITTAIVTVDTTGTWEVVAVDVEHMLVMLKID